MAEDVFLLVFLAFPFPGVFPMLLLVGVPFFGFFGAGAGVDVSKVERVGLREAAQIEPYDDPVGSVLEGGATANPGVALGAQFELFATAVVIFLLLALATASLRTATAAPYHREDGYKRDNGEHEWVPHAVEDSN